MVILYLLALVVRIVTALPEAQPGYMDAAYYYDIADSVARGRGLSENFLWNYLSNPTSLPQPSNAYWMPITSLVIAPFLWLGNSYRAAQIPFVLLAALLAPVTYALSLKLFGRKDWALVSALLMLASSFYAPFWPALDSFAIFALLGTGVLWLSARPAPVRTRTAVLCGALVGLAHLTRADGFLLLLAPLAIWRMGVRPARSVSPLLVGYLAVMLPWFVRNLAAFGMPLPGGGSLFMRSYNDLFFYDQPLTLDTWLAGGAGEIAGAWLRALALNSATLAGALHFVYLPLVWVAAWRERRRAIVRAGAVLLAGYFVLSTFVFSQSGPRGTFLHALAALLPLLYALAPAGLAAVIAWVAARRTAWNAVQAERVFGIAFLLMAVVLSAFLYAANVFGSATQPGWNDRFKTYQQIDAFLVREGGTLYGPDSPILCINPPAYFYFAQHPAIALPTDDALALIHAGAAFGARMFILEPDHPGYLDTVYDFTVPDQRFQLRATFADSTGGQVQLYQIVPLR